MKFWDYLHWHFIQGKVQGLYRFLDTKFKTFSGLFFQNNNYFFFQTQGYHIGDQQRRQKTWEQSFFVVRYKHMGEIE